MTRFTVLCPYDQEEIELEVTFEGDPPLLNLNAPALQKHMQAIHGDIYQLRPRRL